jgi:hypothetical protein
MTDRSLYHALNVFVGKLDEVGETLEPWKQKALHELIKQGWSIIEQPKDRRDYQRRANGGHR